MGTIVRQDVPLEAPDPEGEPQASPDPTDTQAVLKDLIDRAVNYVDLELSPLRAQATDYYHGKPLGNEEKGRSQVVITEVRDTLQAALSPMLRVVWGPEPPVEFVPPGLDLARADPQFRRAKIDACAQATDYIREIVFGLDNNGFLVCHDWIHDAFLKKLGIVKAWAEPHDDTVTELMSGLNQEQVQFLAAQPGVTYEVIDQLDGAMGPIYDLRVSRSVSRHRIRVAAVPPEEFLVLRDTRSLAESMFFGHRKDYPVRDLLAMGIPETELERGVSEDRLMAMNVEAQARNPAALLEEDSASNDDMSRKVTLYEVYAKIGASPQWRKFLCLGRGRTVLNGEGEPVRRPPFFTYCPLPEPHTLIGQSLADLTMDLQRIESAVIRANIDSLGLSIHDRMWYVEGQVNPHDVMNTEIGAGIRCRAPGMFGFSNHQYLGKETFPLLAYLGDLRDRRTGRDKGMDAMDPASMQSTTPDAVTATLRAGNERLELLARLFVEGSLRPLFEELYHLVKEHQDQERVVKLRGKFVAVNPSTWDDRLEARCIVGVGAGRPEEKLTRLGGIIQKQEAYIQQLGPQNPLTGGLARLSDAVRQATELAGFPDVDRYFAQVTPEQDQQMAQAQAQQPPTPTPEMLLAQAQAKQIEAELAMKQAQLQLDREEMLLKDALEHEKLRQGTEISLKELELKYHVQLNEQQVRAEIEGRKALTQAAIDRHEITMTDQRERDMSQGPMAP